jgi:hypothetical protein
MVMRFKKSNAAVATVTWTDLMNLLVMASSATVGYTIYDAIKLRKVKAYMLPCVNTSSTGVSIAPLKVIMNGNAGGTSFGSDRTVQAYPGQNGAKVSIKPTPPLDDWVNTGNASAAFSVYGPVGVVVDIHLTIQLRGGITAAPTALTSTGASTGAVYGNYLDSSGTQFLQNDVAVNNTLVWS